MQSQNNINAHYCTVCSPHTWSKMHCCENSSALFRKHPQPWQSRIQNKESERKTHVEGAQGEQTKFQVRPSSSSFPDNPGQEEPAGLSDELCCSVFVHSEASAAEGRDCCWDGEQKPLSQVSAELTLELETTDNYLSELIIPEVTNSTAQAWGQGSLQCALPLHAALPWCLCAWLPWAREQPSSDSWEL